MTAAHLPKRLPLCAALALAAACATTPPSSPAAAPAPAATGAGEARLEDVRAQLHALADDSMQGRLTGTEGMVRSARYIARQLQEAGVRPAGGDGYLQRLPLAMGSAGRGPRLLPSWDDTAAVRPAQRGVGVNVIGVVDGSDPALRDQVVMIAAHYDHLGIGKPVGGDSIYNGADDDASGVVTVLQIARALASGPPPKRTVLFLLSTGEEEGLLGTCWYIRHPVLPIERMAAQLEIEMVGRPDPAAGGAGKAWLTGYERSTLGDALAANGVPIVADPRPAENFFERSDNIAYAMLGIPAHTLSTFNLHADYHQPGDEAGRIDYAHMTEVVRAAVRAARLVVDGPAPTWKPGGRPAPGSACGG